MNGVVIKTIPGLKPADVYLNMEKSGFRTNKNIKAEISTFTSNRYDADGDYVVMATGDASHVTSVDATLTNTPEVDNAKASEFLGYVATLPYKNANPYSAKEWVRSNIEKGSDTVISGVSFRLISGPSAKTLRLTMPD